MACFRSFLSLTRYAFAFTAFIFCVQPAFSFTKGADVSWLSQMEDSGYQFYDDNGNPADVLQILKNHGMDSIRLRVWVNPAGGWYNSMGDVIAKARRAQAAGMRILIDFHYSDTWADPGNQSKPAQWNNLSFNNLMATMWQYTVDSLTQLRNAGITPEWVQVGNETNNGMLWEDGRASTNMQNFAWLVNTGYNAVKEVFPSARVIVHISNCHDNALFRWIFDGLRSNGAQWDIIGASSYPRHSGLSWQNANNSCLSNLNDMVSRYSKDVMVVELGIPWDDTEARTIVADMISKVRSVNGGRGQGVFYWEPQAYNWQGYTLGTWNPNTGRPTATLDAFLEGQTPPQNPTPTPTATPTSTPTATPTQPPSSGSNSFVVRARGTSGQEHINLRVDSSVIGNWTLSTTLQNYSASTNANGAIQVEFDNDAGGRDVQIDYIQVNGQTRQAENQVENTGVWANNACGGGSNSEWLHCNGYIGFGQVSGSTTTPPTPTPTPAPTNPPSGQVSTLLLQENASGFCGVDGVIENEHSGYTGSGYANTTNATNQSVRYQVSVPADGTYQIEVRYANGSSNRPGNLVVNSSNAGSFAFGGTGAWTTYSATGSLSVFLNAGNNAIALTSTSSGGLPNIDRLSITGISPSAVNCN